MARRLKASPERLLAAAATEFAERGFAGARVDRIAKRAGANKAMIYYHFKSKLHLYRALLRDTFSQAATRLNEIADSQGPSADKLSRAVSSIEAFIEAHAYFPAIMMREMADGGARLDRATLSALSGVPGAFGRIVHDGVVRGELRPVHPMFAYMSTIAPIVFFLAAGTVRQRMASLDLMDMRALPASAFVEQMQESLRRSLAPVERSVR